MTSPRRSLATRSTILALLATAAISVPVLTAGTASADDLTISRSSYYDKTLAGIIGEVGGFLSGYEFASVDPGPHPDDWFDPANGPYAGNFAHFTPGEGADRYVRLLAPGRVRGQDNYFMDFFNQRVIEEKGLFPGDADLRGEYLAHGISDYGGSDIAEKLMSSAGMLPFQTGQHEFNDVSWCCEPYIETDTLGFIAPGMPNTARDLADRFAQVSGSFDTQVWSRFMATLMSLAYTNTDARVALSQAASTLPHDSWPYRIYSDVAALHQQNPDDWRWAQSELLKDRRWLYGGDDDRVLADINQGIVLIAILYGGNDYLQTLKIAAIGGNEGVDNATPIGGLMGVIKGMAGTPQAFLDKIYAGGNGVFVNDNSGAIQTYVRRDYPAEQKFTDIAALYQRNAETAITAFGGSVSDSGYRIAQQAPQVPVTVPVSNGDFETGTLDGWTATPAGNARAETQVSDYNAWTHSTLSHSGSFKGTVFTDSGQSTVTLTHRVSGLTIGRSYRARAYVASMGGARAAFTVDPGSGEQQASADSTEDMTSAAPAVKGRMFAERTITFTAMSDAAVVGLRLMSPSAWAAIDDVSVEQVTAPALTRYEAESATLTGGAAAAISSSASGGSYAGGLGATGAAVSFPVNASAAGEQRFTVRYASDAASEDYSLKGSTWNLPAGLDLIVNGTDIGRIVFPRTGRPGEFHADQVAIPVSLNAGANTVTLRRSSGAGTVDIDYADMGPAVARVFADAGSPPEPARPARPAAPLANRGFEDRGGSLDGWSTWPGTAGTDAGAAFTESGGHGSPTRLTHYRARAYEVYTSQQITALVNGTYTVRAWVVGGGDQSAVYLDAKGYGGGDLRVNLPRSGWPNWQQVTIPNIAITDHQVTIGLYSKANGGDWMSLDDVELIRQ